MSFDTAVIWDAGPVSAPTNAVEVIEVAPVITPASTTIVPSKTTCCPARGVMLRSVPPVVDIVVPSKLRSSTLTLPVVDGARRMFPDVVSSIVILLELASVSLVLRIRSFAPFVVMVASALPVPRTAPFA